MAIFRKCSFYRDSNNPATGRSIGYCDLKRTICVGDALFCRNLEALRKHHLEQRIAKRWSGWRNVHSFGNQKLVRALGDAGLLTTTKQAPMCRFFSVNSLLYLLLEAGSSIFWSLKWKKANEVTLRDTDRRRPNKEQINRTNIYGEKDQTYLSIIRIWRWFNPGMAWSRNLGSLLSQDWKIRKKTKKPVSFQKRV